MRFQIRLNIVFCEHYVQYYTNSCCGIYGTVLPKIKNVCYLSTVLEVLATSGFSSGATRLGLGSLLE